MNHPQNDLVLIFLAPDGPFVSPELWESVRSSVALRLESVHLITWSGDSETLKTWIARHPPNSRIVIVPLGLFEPSRFDIRSCLAFAGIQPSTAIFIGKPPSTAEIGAWIRSGTSTAEGPSRVELIPPKYCDEETIDHLAAIAYWAGGPINCLIRGDRRMEPNHISALKECLYLPFTSEPFSVLCDSMAQGAVAQRGSMIEPWAWVQADTLSTWLIGNYLQALNTQPLGFSNQASEQAALDYLERLADAQYSILPKDYRGRLDTVAPTSMGSASLIYDADGKVRWDSIWTSFCDLAMAGGPPHRGSLLTNVPIEDIERQQDQYDQVVAELRRGIELASRLPTCESNLPGWIGVRCHDERMAAWMLRAIIVENILVRREGAILFLPAGPEFRIEKEIKNVITAVAKTTHYWFGHLKVRQPPKPL